MKNVARPYGPLKSIQETHRDAASYVMVVLVRFLIEFDIS